MAQYYREIDECLRAMTCAMGQQNRPFVHRMLSLQTYKPMKRRNGILKSIIFRNTKNVLFVLLSISIVIFCCACGELDETNMFASNDPTQGSTLAQSTGPTLATDPTQNTQPTQNNNPTQNGNGTPSDDNSDYIIGGSGTSSDVSSPFVARCKIQKSFSAGDACIPVEFSFGVVEGCGVDTNRYKEIVVYATNSDEQYFIIRQFSSEEFLQPEYTAKGVWNKDHTNYVDFIYGHKETIDLPLSMFTGDSGRIWIGFHECSHHNSEQHKRGNTGGVWLYYERNVATNSIHIVKHIENN